MHCALSCSAAAHELQQTPCRVLSDLVTPELHPSLDAATITPRLHGLWRVCVVMHGLGCACVVALACLLSQEGGAYLERSGSKPDEDAKTRGMQKKLEGIQEEAPPKPKVPRTTTMAATAQVQR